MSEGTRGPIFIVGAMGSGTTLLRLVLDSHPNIAVPQETGFMRAYDAHRYTPFKASGRGWMKRLGWSDEERDELLRDLYDRMFMRYAEKHGKRRWGEKTPLHTWHVDDMARLFPDAQFIGVIRHPSASVASNMTRFRLLLTRTRAHWNRYTGEIARQAARHQDRFALIRYEDLVLDPEPVLRELLDWLGEPWSDAVLQHHEVQSERGGRKRVEGRSRSDEPIDTSRVDKWKRTLRPDHQRWLAERTHRRAEFFGYDMDEPVPVRPMSEESGGPVAYGPEIDRRIDAFLAGGSPLNGARIVARAWVDPEYKKRLLEEGTSAAAELGYKGPQGEHIVVVENTPAVHHVIVCTLCSCYPWPVLGLPPSWYKNPAYRARVVREPRAVLAEWGTELGPDVDVRVHDSSSEVRYLVLPERPAGSENLSEEELVELVTREAMTGVATAKSPA